MDINKLFNIDGKTALITGGSRGIGENDRSWVFSEWC